MTDDEAIAACERWFAHLDYTREKTEKIQRLAILARQGPEQQAEAKRQLQAIDRQPHVYDAGHLEPAVRYLVKHFNDWKIY